MASEPTPARYTITNCAGSLGDWLSLTPILRYWRDLSGIKPIVFAQDAPHTREFATLYEGLAEVEWATSTPPTPETKEDHLCFSQRILNAHGINGVSPIPYVEVTEAEKTAARALLAPYSNPVAFNNTVGAGRPDLPETAMCNYRRLSAELTKKLVTRITDADCTPIRFGTKGKQTNIYSNYEEIEGVVNLPDLSLRQLAACYAVIGEYIGTDSGDRHLMLAVGGFCHVYVPPSTWFYQHTKHFYGSYAWGNEIPREAATRFYRPLPTS